MRRHRFLIAAVALLGVVVPFSASVSTSSADTACTTSANDGACFFAQDSANFPGVELGSGRSPAQGIEIDQDVWNANSCPGMTQTLTASSDQSWSVAANFPASTTGAVCSYPNEWPHDAQGTVDSYAKIQQSFAETFPHNAQTFGHAMDDLWFDSWHYEVMVQYDFSNDAPCEGSWPLVVSNVDFAGQPWHLCESSDGQSLVWKLGASDGAQEQSESSGTIHVLRMVKWLEHHGYLGADPATWTAISAGFEIQSTDGLPTTWSYSENRIEMVKSS